MAQLVLEAFGPPQPPGHEPRHYPDPDLRNNAIENVRWVPDGTNLIDHPALVEAGKNRSPHRALTDDEALEAIRLASAGEMITSIAARFGVAKPNTVELAVTYCRGGDCEFVPPLRRGGRGGDFPAEARGIASPRNPPVSPLRKGGIIGNPVADVSYG